MRLVFCLTIVFARYHFYFMKEAENSKAYLFVDESGDPVFFDKHGNDLVANGKSSSIFMVGFMQTEKPNEMHKQLTALRRELENDDYLKDIPSLSKSLKHFHAKDDCPEVREKVFKLIKNLSLKTHIVVARKNTNQFKTKFNGKASKLYEYLVSKLFENRLHLHSEIDIYFSKMGSTVREHNMRQALNKASEAFHDKWGGENNSHINVFVQEPSQIAPLQIIDYLLWVVYRVYTKGEMRYFRYLEEKYSMIIDIFDHKNYPKNYYSKKNPLDIKKISPLVAR